jgi:hypothetical protein
MEADVRVNTKRRQMGDIGITAQRYTLALYGNDQQLRIESWQPESKRTAMVPFEWKAGEWYRLKIRVQNLDDGKVRITGMAWKRDDPEPGAWTLDKTDPIGNREGSPGFFIDTQFGAYFANVKVTPN